MKPYYYVTYGRIGYPGSNTEVFSDRYDAEDFADLIRSQGRWWAIIRRY